LPAKESATEQKKAPGGHVNWRSAPVEITAHKRNVEDAHNERRVIIDNHTDEEKLRIAIELLSKYEYKDGTFPGPIKPSPPYPKPVPGPVRPPPLPWKEYKPKEKRSESTEINSDEQDDIRAAIEILSSYEYKGGSAPHYPPIKPVKPIPLPAPTFPAKPYGVPSQPYKPTVNKREALSEEQNLRLAIETLSRWEYRNQARDPQKRDNIISDLDRDRLRSTIELLTNYEYFSKKPDDLVEIREPGKPNIKQADAHWDD